MPKPEKKNCRQAFSGGLGVAEHAMPSSTQPAIYIKFKERRSRKHFEFKFASESLCLGNYRREDARGCSSGWRAAISLPSRASPL